MLTAITTSFFGGDQLTVARARGAQGQRENSNSGEKRLEGLVPVVEDWHTQMNLLIVSLLLFVYLCTKHSYFSYV